jgi:acyl-CoA thioester hydrolase
MSPANAAEADLFRHGIRVYWEDTDAGGVVFYANYLKFFERARTEWLRAKGYSQERLRVETGTVFIVTETAVRFLRPARLDDLLDVTVRVTHRGQASLSVAQTASRSAAAGQPGELLAEGTIRIGCVEVGTFKPCRIPNPILLSLR